MTATPCTCPTCQGRASREVCLVQRQGRNGTWLNLEQHLVRCWGPGGPYVGRRDGVKVGRQGAEPCPVVILVELPVLEPA